jgi:hypothetical protein
VFRDGGGIGRIGSKVNLVIIDTISHVSSTVS